MLYAETTLNFFEQAKHVKNDKNKINKSMRNDPMIDFE